MSYHTAYTISVDNVPDDILEKIKDRMEELGIIGYAVNYDLSCAEPVNWFSEEEDMLILSREFSDVHFEVHGEGENQGDIWEDHFLGGKVQRCNAQIVIPEFDPEQLVDPDN